jgi:tRNA pseudouridine55 synthase
MADYTGWCKIQSKTGARWVAPRRAKPLSGIINVDKPPGLTSHDVVDAIRRVVGQRKVGHAGTLDPMATGVLLVCLGQATRVSEYLMSGQKLYRATVALGTSTETYDAEGEVTSRGGRTSFDREEIETALQSFVGSVDQVPPVYSALKRDGQPLYKLARQGKKVDLGPRPVQIDSIDLLDWTSPLLIIEVTCSPGTYIRSLAHDLGQRLGSGAHLAALVRLRSGRFSLQDAVSLERLEEAFREGQGERYLIPLDEALLDWPAIVVGSEDARRLANGQAIVADLPVSEADKKTMYRAYSIDGEFLAILAFEPEANRWQPKKVFAHG